MSLCCASTWTQNASSCMLLASLGIHPSCAPDTQPWDVNSSVHRHKEMTSNSLLSVFFHFTHQLYCIYIIKQECLSVSACPSACLSVRPRTVRLKVQQECGISWFMDWHPLFPHCLVALGHPPVRSMVTFQVRSTDRHDWFQIITLFHVFRFIKAQLVDCTAWFSWNISLVDIKRQTKVWQEVCQCSALLGLVWREAVSEPGITIASFCVYFQIFFIIPIWLFEGTSTPLEPPLESGARCLTTYRARTLLTVFRAVQHPSCNTSLDQNHIARLVVWTR